MSTEQETEEKNNYQNAPLWLSVATFCSVLFGFAIILCFPQLRGGGAP